jgi:hypothetical protein
MKTFPGEIKVKKNEPGKHKATKRNVTLHDEMHKILCQN